MLHFPSMAAEQTATLTQTCPRCAAKIETSAAEPLARIECPQCGEKLRVERAFNNFVIVETLGIGGMGTVYKARDTLLERDVALKLLRDDLAGEVDQATRLREEARVAASVNHPNVIQVFSSGIDHGKFYLVMELVDRGSLDDLIEEKKRLPEDLVVASGIQVAKGLRAAYAKGLIHRDVKPANILFADEHTAKIGDFGLAGAAAEQSGAEIWGTPYYVAPERLKNEAEDFRSDIYSLGATLFHALAGRAPIEGDTNSATALRQLKERPLDLRIIAPQVSKETAQVLTRMLAPDPAQRFTSYDELVRALERAHGILTGAEEFLGKRRRHRLMIGLAILAAALVAVGAWALISGKRAAQAVDAAKAQAEQSLALAPLEAQLAEARHELVLSHHNVANTKFAQVAVEAKGQQPLYDLARFQQALALFVARQPSQAQQALRDVVTAGEKNFANDDVDLARFFMGTARTLTSREAQPQNAQSSGAESFALFLQALKQINDREIDHAVPLLEQFVKAKPPAKFAWIADYKPLAQKYLDDARAFSTWKKESAADSDAQTRLQKLRAIKLKMRSAITDEIEAEKNRLSAEASHTQKSETAAREEAEKKRAAELAQKKPQWLAQWKRTLIADLNRASYSGAVVDLAGVQYGGIAGATERTLKMKLPYGEAEIPWTKLPPPAQLAIAESFVRPGAPDAAERQWLCAVYASATGQAEAAQRLAEAAALAKPEYHEQISLMFPR